MDKEKVKLIIKEWVKLDSDITILNDKRKELNKKINLKKKELFEKQKEMQIPILQLMNEMDTESIKLSESLSLKAIPVTKTTGVTVKHIKKRLDEYYSETTNSYHTLLTNFIQTHEKTHKINITQEELKHYLNNVTQSYSKLLSHFITTYNIKLSDNDKTEFLKNHLQNESNQIYNYIVDISARKELLEEEILKLKKNKIKKQKQAS